MDITAENFLLTRSMALHVIQMCDLIINLMQKCNKKKLRKGVTRITRDFAHTFFAAT